MKVCLRVDGEWKSYTYSGVGRIVVTDDDGNLLFEAGDQIPTIEATTDK